MTRLPLLAAALTLTLSAPQAAFALTAPEAPVPGPARSGDDAATALRALKADAVRAVRVQRDAQGDVAFVSSTDGRAMLESDATGPRRSVQDQLAKYGEAFGVDGVTSKAVTKQTLDSSTGGTVVRAEQVVDGVPVFGGQLVMSLDEDQGVVSVASATTDATQVPDAVVSESQARRTALAVTAKHHGVRAGQLSVTSDGRRLYDPAIVHTTDPLGTRPVWQFEVTNGADIRETVLVGTGRGEVALKFNNAPHLNRRVCDNAGLRANSSSNPVPACSAPVRTEGAAALPLLPDVNRAYDNMGATSDAYAALDAKDLTDIIGASTSGTKALEATVRWCFAPRDDDANGQDDFGCPYRNAFWDGTQMVFGAGYADADDVVGHELTHGYVERTAGLFYHHQSGAVNESLADTLGEIVDHRNPLSASSDTNWTIGEDLGAGELQRSMKDPTTYGQPDRMTSSNWDAGDFFDDNGAVHHNNGVGNKTAYLISQGGSFNGRSVTGIDVGDTGLAKTGRLYLETIPRLTSGAEYADLGRTLVATCDELAGASTGGFTSTNCDAVRSAVAATELASPPTAAGAAAPEVAVGCPTATTLDLLKRDDDAQQDFGFTLDSLWQRTPQNQSPDYVQSGQSSLFGWDPDPNPDTFGDPPSSSATTAGFSVPTGRATHLNFHHAYLFEFDGTEYYDGGQVLVQRLVNGTWTTTTGLPWTNGATKTRFGTSAKVFGGDSHGYGSSQVNLSSLAGQTVRVIFRVDGDSFGAFYGWWLDDIRLYTCTDDVASAPATTVTAATTSAAVSWTAPAHVGSSPIASYRISRSDGKVNTAPATARTITLTGLAANTNVTVSVAAVAENGQVGAASSVPIYGTSTTVTAPARVRKGQLFTVTAKVVRRGTTSVISGMPVTLQRRVKGSTLWRAVSSSTTSAAGTRSWSVKQSSVTSYRVVSKGVRTYLGTTSALRTVLLR